MKIDIRGYRISGFIILCLFVIYRFVWKSKRLLFLGFGISYFILWFHRDPERKSPQSGFVSPVDGRVKNIEKSEDRIKISVYLGITDVHIVRSPINGKISNIYRTDGYNIPAFMPSSEKNNKLSYQYTNKCQINVMTGFIARRLQSKVSDEQVERGEKIGLISFGSRSVITINRRFYRLNISEGDKIIAGKTKMATPVS